MSGLCSIFVVAVDKLGHIMWIQVHFLDAWSHTESGQQHGLPAFRAVPRSQLCCAAYGLAGPPPAPGLTWRVEQWLQLRG